MNENLSDPCPFRNEICIDEKTGALYMLPQKITRKEAEKYWPNKKEKKDD